MLSVQYFFGLAIAYRYNKLSILEKIEENFQNQYLSREDEIPSFFCGLIDDVLKCLLTRSCPSYFLPHVNLLDKTDDATILSLGNLKISCSTYKILC